MKKSATWTTKTCSPDLHHMSKSDFLGERASLWIDYVRTSFWAVPAFLLLLAACLAALTMWLDVVVLPPVDFGAFQWLNPSQMSGVRELLATTAAAILGVAGVTFSITIASLTLASQQFGPRLIRNFTHDRFTQTVLGFFIATFFYCMLTMQLDSVVSDQAYSPLSTLLAVLVLTVVDLLMLVLFIHHICKAIQAETIIFDVAEEMRRRAISLLPLDLDDAPEEDQEALEHLQDELKVRGDDVLATSDGYVRAIDYAALLKYADKHGQLIGVRQRAGDYVLAGSVLARVIGANRPDDLDKTLNDLVVIGPTRNPRQDLEFSIRQLVEIALRALSPGINDPFTAITCINHLGALINMVASRATPPSAWKNEEGDIRLLVKTTTFDGLVESAFNQIRQEASSHVDVTVRLLDVLHELIVLARNRSQMRALLQQARLIRHGVKNEAFISHDQQAIFDRFEDLEAGLQDKKSSDEGKTNHDDK